MPRENEIWTAVLKCRITETSET